MQKNVFVLLCFLVSTHLFSQNSTSAFIETVSRKFDKEFETGAGGVAAIVHKGKVVYKKSFGHEYAGGPEITEDTYFSIGSVSKSVATLVIADLIAEKKLQLTTPLSNAFANAPSGVEVHDLLSHNSGFRFKGNWQIEHGRTRNVLISEIMRQGLGKKEFLYNNLAFSLVENIIEQQTGLSWTSVFHQYLAKRGLEHITISNIENNIPLAHPHFKTPQIKKLVSVSRLPKYYPERVSSSAGVFASLKDLVKFAQLQFLPEFDYLHLPRVEANDILNCSVSFPVKRDKIRASYALGWRVIELKDDKGQSSRMVYHGGYLRGISAFVGLIKTHDLAVIMVRNDELYTPTKVVSSVWGAYLEAFSS